MYPRITIVMATLCLGLGLGFGLAACDEPGPPSADPDAMDAEACCDPAEQPGAGNNPPCFEGASCCGNGTWQCNDFGGTSTCADEGGVCNMGVCDPAEEPGAGTNPPCIEGHSCCPDGEWACNNGAGQPACPM